MRKCNTCSINSIETFGLLDGPGIRTVVFLNQCNLRCKFCHNPETWLKQKNNSNKEELLKKILRNKSYFKNNGGVTFSGGEPLLQYDFLVDISKDLKKEGIHIAIDTAGIGNQEDYSELLNTVDLILLDIKAIDKESYINITQRDYLDKFTNFIKQLNKSKTEVWIRQVIIPNINDNEEYLKKIKNITKIEFLPYHTMAKSKYEKLNIKYPYQDIPDMDENKCNELYNKFEKYYKNK